MKDYSHGSNNNNISSLYSQNLGYKNNCLSRNYNNLTSDSNSNGSSMDYKVKTGQVNNDDILISNSTNILISNSTNTNNNTKPLT